MEGGTEAGGCFCRPDIAASAAAVAAAEQTELCSFCAPAERAGGREWDRRRMSSGMEVA